MEIKDVIKAKLTNSFPDHNIYIEENVGEILKPALVIRVYPISMAIENKYHRRKFINVQIYYHSENGTNGEDLDMIDALYEVFDPVLIVKDRILPVGVIHTRVKDNTLRLSFNLDFIDSIDETKSYNYEEYELMEELEMKEEF
ncbi:phage tail terminator family protein [Wukongibacter baidiensis]|uniref:phage tail terminator family protein n=1 Tax=Wukongibacter baidiensis TaxID=1723361 RepID=UPI003D7FA6D5